MKNLQIHVNLFNLSLIGLGVLLLAIGLYRTIPIKIDKNFLWQNVPLIIMLLIGSIFMYQRMTEKSMTQWAMSTIGIAGRFLPLIILLCTAMALGGVLTTLYEKRIEEFLLKHNALAPFLSALIVPTPSTMIPIVEKHWHHELLKTNSLWFLQTASLMSIPLFMLRQMGFKNNEISIKMYIAGFLISVLSFPAMPAIHWMVNRVYILLRL